MKFKMSKSLAVCCLMTVIVVDCDFTNARELDSTLSLVQVVFRHGERTPDKLEAVLLPEGRQSLLNDHYGFGQLTINGKRQEYELGRMLRERYDEFLGDVYRPDLVFGISSSTDRTKASLQLVLASLYPPVEEFVWETGLKWDPVPTYSVPWELDNFFNLPQCPKYDRFYKQLMNSTAMRQKLGRYKDLFKLLSGIFPNKNIDLEQIFYLNNLMLIAQIFNTTLPKWPSKDVREEMKGAAKLYLDSLSYNPNLIKLNGGAMAKRLLSNMDNPSKRKIYLYSGHEFTLYALTKAHNVTLEQSPPFGSAIILEKHTDSKNNSNVKMFLWTGPSKKLLPIKLGECDEFCSMKEYKELLKPLMPLDEDMRCLYKNVRWSELEKYFNFDEQD